MVITNLDSSKVSGPDCITVVVLKNCESELSYILAELLNTYLKESRFPDCWEISPVVPVFKNAVERSTAKNYRLLSVVSKVFEKLVNNRFIDHLVKCGHFSDFQYSFSIVFQYFLYSLLDQVQIFWELYLRIDRAFGRSGATPAVILGISKTFDRVWHAGLFHKRKSYEISGRYLDLFHYFFFIGFFFGGGGGGEMVGGGRY